MEFEIDSDDLNAVKDVGTSDIDTNFTDVPSELDLVQQRAPADNRRNSMSYSVTQPWPGRYGFSVSVEQSKNYFYSATLQKLFVNFDSPCVINFATTSEIPPRCMLKISLEFSKPQDVEDKVERCYFHRSKENGNFDLSDHVLRVVSQYAQYECTDQRNYVIVPYNPPSADSSSSKFLLKFMCLSSCIGGMNRRQTQVVFSLEKNDVSIGRQCLEVKISKCPQRDMRKEELAQTEYVSKNESEEVKKTKYKIKVKDVKVYQYLLEMQKLYRASAFQANVNKDDDKEQN